MLKNANIVDFYFGDSYYIYARMYVCARMCVYARICGKNVNSSYQFNRVIKFFC